MTRYDGPEGPPETREYLDENIQRALSVLGAWIDIAVTRELDGLNTELFLDLTAVRDILMPPAADAGSDYIPF